MNHLDTSREQLIALVAGAIVFLIARILAREVGAPVVVERAFYFLTLACLVACVVVVLNGRKS